MAKKIIVLENLAADSGAAGINYRVAYWLSVPVARQPMYANALAKSTYAGATQQEADALTAGQVVEMIDTISYPNGTTIAAVQADLIARFNAAQDALTGTNKFQRYGTSWDGNSWAVAGA